MIGAEGIDRFTRDVDRLLAEAGVCDAALPDDDYRRDLILAAEIAATDFSDESTRRRSLRRELLGAPPRARRPARGALAAMSWPRALAAAAAVLIVAWIVVLAEPTLRAAVARPVIEFVQHLVLGEHTSAVVAAPLSEAETEAILAERRRALEAGEQWTVETAVGRAGGDVPPGRDAVVRTYSSLRLARAAAAIPIRTPVHLPEGYRFDRAVLTPDDGVILWYRTAASRITLSQKPTAPDRYSTFMTLGGDRGASEEVNVGGHAAAWINGQSLVWEADGRSWSLEGDRLSLDEARAIAESLR